VLAECIRDGLAPSLGTGAAAACEFFRCAVAAARTPDLQAAGVAFVANEVMRLDAAADESLGGANEASMEERGSALLEVLSLVAECEVHAGGPQDVVAVRKCEALLRGGVPAAVAERAVESSVASHPGSWRLWELALRLQASRAAAGTGRAREDAAAAAESLVCRALLAVDRNGVWRLLAPALALLLAERATAEPVVQRLVEMLRISEGEPGVAAKVAAAVLAAVWCALATGCMIGRCLCITNRVAPWTRAAPCKRNLNGRIRRCAGGHKCPQKRRCIRGFTNIIVMVPQP
jgi:hypothetical protein